MLRDESVPQGMIAIPRAPQPQTASGGNRSKGNPPLDAKWNRREPIPFMYDKQADHVDDTACTVCEAPLHKYEVEEHLASCEAIAASDGLDKPLILEEIDD